MKIEELAEKAVKVEENLVTKGSELVKRLDSESGALVRLLATIGREKFSITAVYIRGRGFLWASASRISGTVEELSPEEALRVARELENADAVIGDVFWLDEVTAKEILLELLSGGELRSELMAEQGTVGSVPASSESTAGIELSRVEGIDRKAVEKALSKALQRLVDSDLHPELDVELKFRRFPLGRGGVFNVMVRGKIKRGPEAPFNVRDFVEKAIREALIELTGGSGVVKVEWEIALD